MQRISPILILRQCLTTALALLFLASTGSIWADTNCTEQRTCSPSLSHLQIPTNDHDKPAQDRTAEDESRDSCDCECPCHSLKTVPDPQFTFIALLPQATQSLSSRNESLLDGPYSKIDQPPKLSL